MKHGIALLPHETIAQGVHVRAGDHCLPAELELPAAGLLRLADPESGAAHLVDTGSPRVRQGYRTLAANRVAARKALLISTGAGFLEVGTQTSSLHPLMQFFLNRRRGQGS